jgi:uncharacterized membrane protein YfcA
MQPEIFIIAAVAVLFAGISKGGFGGSVAFVSSAILALVMKPSEAVGLMLPLLMLMDAGTLRPFWKQWEWPQAKLLIWGGIPGILVGTLLFAIINDDMLRLLLGAISITFVVWRLWPKTVQSSRQFSAKFGFIAGVFAGFTSFVSHAGGPPAAMYLLPQNLGKTRYHATVTLVFWVLNALKFIPYAFLGIFTFETFRADLYLAPLALLGVWIGVKAHHMIPEYLFFRVTYFCLACTGTKLIWDALT